LSYEGTKLTSG